MKGIKNLKQRISQTLLSLAHDLAKGFRIGIGFLLAIGTAGLLAVSVTGTFNTFSSGGVMKAADINANFATLKAAIEGLPNWTSSGANAVFSGGNVTVGGSVSSSNLGIFCGLTTGTYNGFQQPGGFTKMKGYCETTCGNTNAHMCTAHEYSISLQKGLLSSLAGQSTWYDSGSMIYNTTTANWNQCGGWNNNSGTASASAIDTNTLPGFATCNSSLKIACCL